ncbi:MAG: 2-hydroxy-3-oxopropionate reductase [SAR202 cluster bacterium]|jgi:2-hydroxy-3-oxopropionate reductase|nr:2-hydroxy-3-oxopropionate reductase [Chloroflexota bacterium]MEC9107069.1 2-hydroxy-3-oxopropionate reductase [Chloroflexota bacterium]MQG20331.1 2-hydroxy-3-oxopropionate reductase [SAR202 cluster bacterium]MQG24210.1 2-hydroxy-3-oxopropionate reductase [SAR202 cluster bacterium]MQG42961.1 2-hydroxy-3-oxopropionate reductase [SAR202 cluster bacterium]|tara:strand:- start:630 stop:1523 length:894 start_codon:yes stop_codon:yes gene_type:complete
MAEKIAFVGLGIMGKPMAKNLMKAGYELYVYDLFPDPVAELEKEGAKGCKSAAEASSNTNITITMVQDGPQAESAILGENGVSDGASEGHLVVDMSSIAPGVSQRIGAGCTEKGINFLDAPVSGGEPFAISGELAIMVGGSADDFEQAKPLFDILGKSAILCGKHGAGQVTKLANQICVGANIHALAEALALAAKSGVNPETVYKAIQGGLAGSNVINAKAPMMVDRNFEPGFRIELHYKDINNAMEAARELNIPLQVTANLQQVLTSLVTKGEGKSDHSAIAKHVEDLAGVEIKKH